MTRERGEKEKSDWTIPEKLPEGASDMEVALFLANHIEHPCGVDVGEGERETLRSFYLREAGRVIEGMAASPARNFLEDKIKEHGERT